VGVGSPFTVSMPDQACRCPGGCRGVGVAGWNISLLVRTLRRLGTLLGPEETPVGVVLWYRSWFGCLTHGCLCGGVVVDVGCGCVLSVA
jgi:hypothetical protein